MTKRQQGGQLELWEPMKKFRYPNESVAVSKAKSGYTIKEL